MFPPTTRARIQTALGRFQPTLHGIDGLMQQRRNLLQRLMEFGTEVVGQPDKHDHSNQYIRAGADELPYGDDDGYSYHHSYPDGGEHRHTHSRSALHTRRLQL